MELKEHLTNESVSKKFENQFDLVTYAIQLAANMIKTGRKVRVKTQTDNPALQIIEEIEAGKDAFEEVKEPRPSPVYETPKREAAKPKAEEEKVLSK